MKKYILIIMFAFLSSFIFAQSVFSEKEYKIVYKQSIYGVTNYIVLLNTQYNSKSDIEKFVKYFRNNENAWSKCNISVYINKEVSNHIRNYPDLSTSDEIWHENNQVAFSSFDIPNEIQFYQYLKK